MSLNYDIFFSIVQTPVAGVMPDEATMLRNFFSQVELADSLGFGTAWVAETHLSCAVQQGNPHPVVPGFVGEIGLNTDTFQTAHKIFQRTKRIHVGSAICNLLSNGGPLARAEALKMFLYLHGLDPQETRQLHFGFAAGRFPFSVAPYGITPRDDFEQRNWKVIKRYIFLEAIEIFLRALKGEHFSSQDLIRYQLQAADFPDAAAFADASRGAETMHIRPRWTFDRLGVIPWQVPMHLTALYVGSHDPQAQELANRFLPCRTFNLSITPQNEIEETLRRMSHCYHQDGGTWQRSYMPRTVLVFLEDEPGLSDAELDAKAQARAETTIKAYWVAMEGTIREDAIQKAVNNALWGSPRTLRQKIAATYQDGERLMLWFDFYCHDQELIARQMRVFMTKVANKC